MAASLTVHILSNPVTFKGWRHYQSTGEHWISAEGRLLFLLKYPFQWAN